MPFVTLPIWSIWVNSPFTLPKLKKYFSRATSQLLSEIVSSCFDWEFVVNENNIINANPCENNSFDFALRSALTYLIHNELNKPDDNSGIGLRYLRDRISVPRDMPLISARLLRKSLEKVACICNPSEIYKIPTKHRYDQNPNDFILSEN